MEKNEAFSHVTFQLSSDSLGPSLCSSRAQGRVCLENPTEKHPVLVLTALPLLLLLPLPSRSFFLCLATPNSPSKSSGKISSICDEQDQH